MVTDRARSVVEGFLKTSQHNAHARSGELDASSPEVGRHTAAPVRYAAMASEDQLLAAAAAAKPFAVAGEAVVGVLVADPFENGLVFLCALGPEAEGEEDLDDDEVPELGWIAVDGEGLALADTRRVQEAATLAALCETAEEAALVPDAGEIAAAAERALALCAAERPELRAALETSQRAALVAAAYSDGLRVARTGYVDELAEAARGLAASARELQERASELSAGLSGEALDPAEPLARAVWEVLERIAVAGSPERFSDALGDAGPAISAFADDVLAHYRAELAEAGSDG
jgi:hypothetical protein